LLQLAKHASHNESSAARLPSNDLLLQEPRRNIDQPRNNECELVGDVTTIRTNKLAERTDIPSLDHTHDPSNNSHRERKPGSNTQRQSLGIIPGIQIIVVEIHLAEDDVLAEQDDEVLRTPVTQQTEEVLQVDRQLLAATNSKTQDCSEAEYHPDEAGNARKGARELLAGDGRAVDRDNVDVDTGEDEKCQNQLGEATGVQHGLDKESEAVVLVDIFPVGTVVEAGRDDCARDHTDGSWDRNTECRHEEDLPAVDVHGVVYIVVRCHSLPGCRATVDDSDQAEYSAAEVQTVDCWGGRVVCILSCLSEKDDEDDEEDDPGISLIHQDSLEADERDQCGYDCQDDDTDDERDVAIRNSSQCKTTCNTSNGCPTDLYNGIEGCDNLVGPPSESISADGDYEGSAIKLVQ
jgi:hypothetical protein